MAIPSKAELFKLDIQSRLELIEELWDSIVDDANAGAELPITEAQRALLDERLREDLANPERARPWSEVRAEIMKQR